MRSPNAFDETRTPFLLEALEPLGTEARETRPRDLRFPAADHECECGRHRETPFRDEALEAEDGYEMEEEDEVGPADAFERYQAADGEAARETERADEAEDMGGEWETVPLPTDEAPAPRDFAESFEADALLETEDETEEEAPDLAYDVQENEDEAPSLDETEAPELESQVPTQVVVSNGEFGKALAHFARDAGLPNTVPWLLRQSAAFNAIVKVLDAKYLHFERPGGLPSQWGDVWAVGLDGVFTKGPHVGRRMLSIRKVGEGTVFESVFSADNPDPMDVIRIETPSSRPSALDRAGEWLERIVHESIHAHRHVLGLRSSGSTPAERIQGSIEDEIETRKKEGQIVNDLRKRFPKFGRYEPTTGSTARGEVERDFFPGRLRLTYLEHFVLIERLKEAREKLEATFVQNKRSRNAAEEIAAYDAFVDRIPLEKNPLESYMVADPVFTRPDRDKSARFAVDYPRLRLIRRIIGARWRSVQDLALNVPGNPKLQQTRRDHIEKMRQEHARLFFADLAGYTKLP
jgi:hypothetical protein